ncbi:MAG: tetratricopeptide repeat protein [Elusimicrobiota bacterium]
MSANSNYAEAYNSLGIALGGQGNIDKAIKQFILAIKANPDLAEAHANLGLALARQGKTDEGIRELRQALQINPGFTPARKVLDSLLEQHR